jgi:aryl-alcohol dehydrogenase-like predicted oxidoreductase
MNDESLQRREFLKRLGLTGAGLLLAGAGRTWAAEEGTFTVPRRKFGRHDFTVSSLALGGHALRVASDEEAARMVDLALELGIDFLDNAWDYHDGRAEELMGRLIEGRRDKFFLMTKVCVHDTGDYKMAMRMLDESLKRLRTDHLDLWQWHALATMDQVKRGFGPDGVVKALTEAKEKGKVRYVGFTGHTDPNVHLAVLAHKYPFDACQLPISAVEASGDGFVKTVLPVLLEQKIAPLAMKTLGGGFRPVKDKLITLEEGLTYPLSQDVTTVVTGVQSADQLRQNARIAATFKAMSKDQQIALVERVRAAAEERTFQPYRKWMSYRDGDAAIGRYV